MDEELYDRIGDAERRLDALEEEVAGLLGIKFTPDPELDRWANMVDLQVVFEPEEDDAA